MRISDLLLTEQCLFCSCIKYIYIEGVRVINAFLLIKAYQMVSSRAL